MTLKFVEDYVEQENTNPEDEIVVGDLKEGLEHAVVVSNLAYYLGKELGESQHVCQELANAGIVHDIGKMKLSSYLYGRAKDLLKIESNKYLHLHPEVGYEILRDREYSQFVLETVRYHHENYDGSGYPNNLKGEEIPYGARIVRVCDVFAALTSDRPYRKAFDKDTAMELMAEQFKDFDMRIFLAFQSMICSGSMDSIMEERQLKLTE